MKAGRRILTAVAGITAVSGFAMDWNRTHLFNPAWTPHAKFHDALTISLGAMLGSGSLYYLHRRRGSHEDNRDIGTLLPALFWAGLGTSFLYPGAEGLESEFPRLVPRVKGVWINERFASGLFLAVIGVGYLLARREGQNGNGHRAV
jgi:hypothetical protein